MDWAQLCRKTVVMLQHWTALLEVDELRMYDGIYADPKEYPGLHPGQLLDLFVVGGVFETSTFQRP